MNDVMKSTLNRQIGILEGLAWGFLAQEKMSCYSDALDGVIEELIKILKADGRTCYPQTEGGDCE